MITCEQLFEIFQKNDLTFFTGVSDSTFKDWMTFLNDENDVHLTNFLACNECEATALAAGYHLATGKLGVIYMQNSGLGKTVNPLTSLMDKDVFSIPAILMVGWRGKPGVKDEPQHVKMGKITLKLLETLEIPYSMLPQTAEESDKLISEMKELAIKTNHPVAIVLEKNMIESYKPQTIFKTNYELTREQAIEHIITHLSGKEVIVATTGKSSREGYSTS